MTIGNYGDLKTSVQDYLNRADLAAYIPNFVRIAERRIHYGSAAPMDSQPVRVPAMQAQTTGTISNSAISFPTGFLETILLRITGNGRSWQAEYADHGTYTAYTNSGSPPTVYICLNNAIQVAGTGGGTYTLDYYKAFDSLTADKDTNWLLTNAPDVYLFGALLESAPFISDLQMVQGWYSMFKSAVNSVNRITMKPGPGALRVRTDTVV